MAHGVTDGAGVKPSGMRCQFCGKGPFVRRAGLAKHELTCPRKLGRRSAGDEIAGAGPLAPISPFAGMTTREAIEVQLRVRRRKVLDLRLRGLGFAAIASALRVHIDTVFKDWDILREDWHVYLRKTNPAARLADQMIMSERMEEEARADYFMQNPTDNPVARIHAGKRCDDLSDKLITRKQEFGLLPRKSEEQRLPLGAKDFTTMTREQIREERDKALARLGKIRDRRDELASE